MDDAGFVEWEDHRVDGERSKAGNAARLERMATEAREQQDTQEERNVLAVQLRECRVARDHALAECERLRLIVDLACADSEAELHFLVTGSEDARQAWARVGGPFKQAVAAEVARRAAL
jgi:hypothetical protein